MWQWESASTVARLALVASANGLLPHHEVRSRLFGAHDWFQPQRHCRGEGHALPPNRRDPSRLYLLNGLKTLHVAGEVPTVPGDHRRVHRTGP